MQRAMNCKPRYYESNVDLRKLCVWMFKRMNESPPFLIAPCPLRGYTDRLIEAAERGELLNSTSFSWSELIEDFYFYDDGQERHKVSARAFHFLASLGEELKSHPGGSVRGSLEKLLELSIGYQDADRVYLKLEGHSDDWMIVSTPLGTEAFGQEVRIRFRERCPLDNLTLESWPIEGTVNMVTLAA